MLSIWDCLLAAGAWDVRMAALRRCRIWHDVDRGPSCDRPPSSSNEYTGRKQEVIRRFRRSNRLESNQFLNLCNLRNLRTNHSSQPYFSWHAADVIFMALILPPASFSPSGST